MLRGFVWAALLASAVASAQPADKLVQIREQQALLTSELDAGVLKVTPREANLIRKEQARVASLLEGRTSLDDLGVADRVQLDNALERINAFVVATRQAAEDADVCRYERNTSSKIRKLDCATASQRQNSRDGARAYLEKPRICVPPGCGQ
jgi:hypothetical protein